MSDMGYMGVEKWADFFFFFFLPLKVFCVQKYNVWHKLDFHSEKYASVGLTVIELLVLYWNGYTIVLDPIPDSPPPSDRQLHHTVCRLLLPLLPERPGEERRSGWGPLAPLQQNHWWTLDLGWGSDRGGGPDVQRAGPEYHRPLEGTVMVPLMIVWIMSVLPLMIV